MKKYSFLIIISLMAICIFTGCSNENKSETNITPTPEVTSTPTSTPEPTPTPVEDKYVELTDEEILSIYDAREQYYGFSTYDSSIVYNVASSHIIAYYKQIGLGDFELPVIIGYPVKDAENQFGGTWEELPDAEMGIFMGDNPYDGAWLRGSLTVDQIAENYLYGEDNRIFITNDPSVETEYDGDSDYYDGLFENMEFSERIAWMRYWGDVYLWADENGTIKVITHTYQPYGSI